MRQIHAQLITAPTVIRGKCREMGKDKRLAVLARMQVPTNRTPVERALLLVLKILAQQCNEPAREHERLGVELDQLVTEANPALRAVRRKPDPASSGKTTRHRLSRGGDRDANGALYRIALVRMSGDQRTRDYVARQREAGFSSRDILRKLRRAIAREIFKILTTPVAVPGVDDLRPLRQAKNITFTAAANQLGVWPTTISEPERGIRRNDDLTKTYREWLAVA